MNKLQKLTLGLTVMLTAVLVGCNKEDDPNPFTVNFESTEFGISGTVTSAEVTVVFSRAISSEGTIAVDVSGSLNYGETADYFTDPAMVDGAIAIPYEKGDESVSFTVYAGSALNIEADQTVTLTFQDLTGNLELGTNSTVTVTFSENFIAPSGTIEFNGGGDEMPNQAFVDLSKLEQTTVDKLSWDLGFYTEAGEHKVVLNNSGYVMARALESSDLNSVVPADTVGFGAQMYLSNYVDADAPNWIDDQTGDLSATAFGTISSTDSENTVFIIKRDGEGRNWKKVRVLQSGDNYTLQYADIDATTFNEVTITKDDAYNFVFFDLDNGQTNVEPEKDKWDLMYGTYANRANFGAIYAIGYKDYIVSNRTGVEIAMVMTEDIAYEEFELSDVANQIFASEINAIGSSWRSGGGPNGGPELYTDRYYILKDSEDNTYKIQFTALYKNTTDRGYPKFSYELITQ